MYNERSGWSGSVERFDSEEELTSFISVRQRWDLAALKQSFVEISEGMGGSDFVPFSPELFDSLSEKDLNLLKKSLREYVGLHGDAKYAHWAYVFKRLNQSFLEEQSSFLKACRDSLTRTPFCDISPALLLLLLAQAYLLEQEKWSDDEASGNATNAESPKERRLKNLKEAMAKEAKINKAADELSKAITAFEKKLSKWAVTSILPDVRQHVDQSLCGQLKEFKKRIEQDRSESLNYLNKGWLEPLAVLVPHDGKTLSKGNLLVVIFDIIAHLSARAAGGGEWKDATAQLLESWGIHVKSDSIKHRRRVLPG